MNVSCPDCRSVFRIDPAKVPEAGIRARCAICGAVFSVEPAHAAQLAEPHAAAPIPRATAETATVAASTEPMTDTAVHEAVPAVVQTSAPASAASGDERDIPVAPTTGAPEPIAVAEPEPQPTPEPRAPEPRSRPVNPYLNNTPELRARRLARALVSDLVAYNPQKREQGLRDGTLRQLFRDEIRKSWDEYVEQVGATVAESTPHFQDALNDVLAGGRRVF